MAFFVRLCYNMFIDDSKGVVYIMKIKKDMFNFLLAKKGLTKAEACRELKLSVHTVNNWLHKATRTPLGKAMYVAEYLEAELEEVFSYA